MSYYDGYSKIQLFFKYTFLNLLGLTGNPFRMIELIKANSILSAL